MSATGESNDNEPIPGVLTYRCRSGWCQYKGQEFRLPLLGLLDYEGKQTPFFTTPAPRCSGCGYEPRIVEVPQELQ